jgi:riboflavin synthase
VNSVSDSTIGMTIIPHTAAITNIGKFTEGGRVNLEVDLIARYIAPYLQK